ncbi:MAG: DUF721 domain-containing protein [Rhodobacteraceae bacterium]|nr:DUF721 domain-containing protein [Paracoccaceae bacterium]
MRRAPSPKKPANSPPKRMKRGFVQTGGILGSQIRRASEKRGFAETRLLTHWAEIVGEAVAKIAQPLKVKYTRQGLGATLTVLCNGANAPMLQMQLPSIIERVNACYGYSAISRIQITQSAPTGFAEPTATYDAKSKKPEMTAGAKQKLETTLSDVADEGLRKALANLGENILTKPKT